MTTLEHAMLGVCGVVALGLDRRLGWQVIPLAAVAGITPDWDGLTLVAGMEVMDQAHRVWGHNLLIAALVAAAWAWCDWKWDLTTRAAAWGSRFVTLPLDGDSLRPRETHRWPQAAAWLSVAIACAWVHLPADMVVSGGQGLSHWLVRPWWPFNESGYVFPCVSWGDPVPSVLFAVGAVGMAARPVWRRSFATLTLAGLLAYLAARRLQPW